MGANANTSLSFSLPPSHLYTKIDYKYCKVWVSENVEHMEEYSIDIRDQKQGKKYEEMFLFRMEIKQFPKTMYFMSNSQNILQCGSQNGIILIQRIIYRLSSLKNLPHQQIICILHKALKSFKMLYKKYGSFKVRASMIGFNNKFMLKIWHHTDLSQPVPQDQYCTSVVEMISSIVRSVDEVSENVQQKFSQFVKKKGLCLFSFQLASKMVQQYAERQNIDLEGGWPILEEYVKKAEGNCSDSVMLIDSSKSVYSKNSCTITNRQNSVEYKTLSLDFQENIDMSVSNISVNSNNNSNRFCKRDQNKQNFGSIYFVRNKQHSQSKNKIRNNSISSINSVKSKKSSKSSQKSFSKNKQNFKFEYDRQQQQQFLISSLQNLHLSKHNYNYSNQQVNKHTRANTNFEEMLKQKQRQKLQNFHQRRVSEFPIQQHYTNRNTNMKITEKCESTSAHSLHSYADSIPQR